MMQGSVDEAHRFSVALQDKCMISVYGHRLLARSNFTRSNESVVYDITPFEG